MVSKNKKLKSPWLAGILNFFIIGLGYIYAGKRRGFGIGLIVLGLIGWLNNYFLVFPLIKFIPDSNIKDLVDIMFGSFILQVFYMVLFSYDAYKTAEEVNREK